jgi:hypothetical protein
MASSILDSRRQERRAKRNMSVKEKELDARLKNIERDNLALMSTLSGIATSFQELNKLYPKGAAKKERALLEGVKGRGGESGDEAGLEA